MFRNNLDAARFKHVGSALNPLMRGDPLAWRRGPVFRSSCKPINRTAELRKHISGAASSPKRRLDSTPEARTAEIWPKGPGPVLVALQN